MFRKISSISFDNAYRFPEDDGFRHEVKYTLTPYEHRKFKGICEGFMDCDINAGETGQYTVKSYYFDTLFFHDYTEKLDGLYARQKYRLRTYGDTGYYRLEKKIKKGNLNKKISGDISMENANMLVNGYTDITTGNETTDAIIREMHLRGCRNQAYIEYVRQVFIIKEFDIRITFDEDIKTLFGNHALNDNMLVPVPVFYKGETILEIKYKEILPQWLQRAIFKIIPSEYSVSKYAHSLSYFLG